MGSENILTRLAEDFASEIPEVDANAEHDRWKPGLGPFEEENQIDRITSALSGDLPYTLDTEVPYLDGGQLCDLVLETDDLRIPIEAKLLRFRYDNGNIDPNSFARVFTPFPEETSASLLTDSRKLHRANFGHRGGLLGLYYEEVEETYDKMSAEAIAEKFEIDVGYWYDFEVETRKVAHFEGLRHPVHQRGAVITWEIVE